MEGLAVNIGGWRRVFGELWVLSAKPSLKGGIGSRIVTFVGVGHSQALHKLVTRYMSDEDVECTIIAVKF